MEVHSVSQRGPSHVHRQHARKLGEVQLCGFWVMWADEPTNRHITILCTPPGG